MLKEDRQVAGVTRIVRPREVTERLGVSRAQFARMVAEGVFPKPFVIVPGGRAVGWFASEVDQWIAGRSATRLGDDQ